MKKIVQLFLISLIFLSLSSAFSDRAHAAAITWDGGGNDTICGGVGTSGNWSCRQNWAGDVVPGSADTVTFNGTSTKNSTLNATHSGTLTSINMATGYSGTITLQRSLTTSSTFTLGAGILATNDQTVLSGGAYSQTGGTFTGGAGNLTLSSTFSLSSGVFTAPAGVLAAPAAFSISGGTFNANGGTITFSGSAANINCNGATFNNVTFTGQTGVKTIGNTTSCSLPVGASPTIPNGITLNNSILSGTGTLTFTTGTFTFQNGSSLVSFSGIVLNGPLAISAATADTSLNLATYSIVDLNSSFTLNTPTNPFTNIFTAPSGTMTVAGNFTINGGEFIHSNGTINFDGSGGVTYSCNNVPFHSIVLSGIASGTRIINSTCSFPLGSEPIVLGPAVTLNGILSGSGKISFGTTSAGPGLAMNSGAELVGFSGFYSKGNLTISGASVDFSNYSPFDLGNSFVFSSGTFTAPSGIMTVNFNFTHSGGIFNHNNGTVSLVNNGFTQTLSGATTFNNLSRVTPGTIVFPSSTTQTIVGALTLHGTEDTTLTLRSSATPTQWSIDPQGSRSINHVTVSDSNNINSTVVTASNSTDGLGNTNWEFVTVTPTPESHPSSTSSNISSSNDSTRCSTAIPGSQSPQLYAAIPQGSSRVTLYFTDAQSPYDHYVLKYGTKSGNYQYGANNIGGRGARTYTVESLSPGTTYYFRIRSGNGCAPGNWSNEISVKTLARFSTNNLQIISSELKRSQKQVNQGSTCEVVVKPGDNLWNIAKEKLGRGDNFMAIIEQNKEKYPSLSSSHNLDVGWKLRVGCNTYNSFDEKVNTENPRGAGKSYNVNVKVVDTEKRPIEGGTVTLHSTPRTAITGKDGVAVFKDVEEGQHSVIISYDGFEGEQSVNLSGETNFFDLNLTVEPKGMALTPFFIGAIFVLIAIFLIRGFLIHKRKYPRIKVAA